MRVRSNPGGALLLLTVGMCVFVSACGSSTVSNDAGEPGADGEVITVAAADREHWIWISMPEMRCANDTDGGFAVNFTDRSTDLLFYLQGGGICYDPLTCAVDRPLLQGVGDDPVNTAMEASIREGRGIFDRTDPTNPLRDSNYVVVPHCTGDFHLGTRVTTYDNLTIHHFGYLNITQALKRLVPTFRHARRIVVGGFSAGGVGATGNYDQIASAFDAVGQPPPYLMADGSPLLRPEFLKPSAQAALRASWGLPDSVDAICPTCLTEGFHEIYRANAARHPGLRSSLISAQHDGVVVLLYSVLNSTAYTGARLEAGLDDLADWTETFASAVVPSAHRSFYYASDRHGALNVDALAATPGLTEFLSAQLGNGTWESVRP